MELQGEKLIPASVDKTWAALNDPNTLRACIAGCESLERTDPESLVAVVAMKVGPVSARFKGKLAMTNVQPPNSYTINFDGQGGVAGFGKGSADVMLSSEGASTRLKYVARATVGGKMAQIGSRLIDATAAKLTEDFFKSFEVTLSAGAGAAVHTPLLEASAATAGSSSSRPAVRRMSRWWWAVGTLVVIMMLYALSR